MLKINKNLYRLLLYIMIVMMTAALFVPIVYADNEDLIPNAEQYFNPKNYPEVWEALDGPMKILVSVIIFISVIGMLICAFVLVKFAIKSAFSKQVVSKSSWGVACIALVVCILVGSGSWYGVINNANKKILKPSVKMLEYSDEEKKADKEAGEDNE